MKIENIYGKVKKKCLLLLLHRLVSANIAHKTYVSKRTTSTYVCFKIHTRTRVGISMCKRLSRKKITI